MSGGLEAFIRDMMPDITPDQLRELAEALPVIEHRRGTILVRQGDAAEDCYFVLKGCLRLFHTDEEGNEHTAELYTELQSLTIFESYKEGKPSPYSVECVEDCLLLEGDMQNEEEMNRKFPFLQDIVRSALESNLASGQMDMALFRSSSPERRYLQLLEKRPGLAGRVPQHQLASYLGITPESLSRLKKRLYGGKKQP
ncbi:MAG: Crp/Fnr family transcriptional regulator [Spirochaetales bacterium]|nr:Crp/Fnr family transcriptional regulator [Spirochaetales bacterium]